MVGILTRGVVNDGVIGVLVAIYVMIADGRQRTPLGGYNKSSTKTQQFQHISRMKLPRNNDFSKAIHYMSFTFR